MAQSDHLSVQFHRRLASFSQSASQLKCSLDQVLPHLTALHEIHDSIRHFNSCFVNFLDAIDMQTSTLNLPIYPQPDHISHASSIPSLDPAVLKAKLEKQQPEPAEMTSDSDAMVEQQPLTLQTKPVSSQTKLNTTKLPPKYRGVAERRVLQDILSALEDVGPEGLSLSELASVSRLSGIQAKEYVAVLIKQGQVGRTKTQKGLTYRLKAVSLD